MKESKEKIKEVLQQFDITQFQINKLADAILEYSCLNSSMDVPAPEICPKCGVYHPHVVKGGMSSTGKQMYRCTSCGKRFLSTNGNIMEYSHLDSSQWRQLIIDTIQGKSLEHSAEVIDVSVFTAFKMRHKLLRYLEERMKDVVLQGTLETDETFVGMNCKKKWVPLSLR